MTASHGHARFPVRLLIVAVGMSLGIGSIVALPLDLCGRKLDLAPTIDGHAALSVPAGASLTILDSGGSGVLRATGATGPAGTGAGAGIGGNGLTSSGHIRIHAGTVIATDGG